MSSSRPQLAFDRAASSPAQGNVMEPLLHALNQPLTGLQCSMELALASPRPIAEYVRTLRDGLTLLHSARILIGGLREIADLQCGIPEVHPFHLHTLLEQIGADLRPVALGKGVPLEISIVSPVTICYDQASIATFLLRLLDSVLTLTDEGCPVHVTIGADRSGASLTTSWTQDTSKEIPPCSPVALGLLISEAEWRSIGAKWLRTRSGDQQSCAIWIPLAANTFPEPELDRQGKIK